MKRKIKLAGILGLLLLSAASCHQGVVFQQSADIDGNWNKDSLAAFTAHITDTIGAYNVFIDLRNDNFYPYQNLWLFVRSVSPDKIERTDTLECILADNDGRWVGTGFGSDCDLALLYMQQIRFPAIGNYRFEIRQAMRDSLLTGIKKVGLRIEKTEAE